MDIAKWWSKLFSSSSRVFKKEERQNEETPTFPLLLNFE
jgi:hypothetical protein